MKCGKGARGGKGWAICARSGFTVPAESRIQDVRGGHVRKESADITPGFGTHHPRDRRPALRTADPTPIKNPASEPADPHADQLSDAEILHQLRQAP